MVEDDRDRDDEVGEEQDHAERRAPFVLIPATIPPRIATPIHAKPMTGCSSSSRRPFSAGGTAPLSHLPWSTSMPGSVRRRQ